jgi:hypothetical protein
MQCVSQFSQEFFRYSNTLLVSLNNRIYFRDHPMATVVVDSEHGVASDLSRHFAVTSQFSPGRPPSNTNTADEGFNLHSISHPMRLVQDKGDEASIISGQRRVCSILTVIRYF